ncbi:MAG: transglutaminase-like cysteine peptidase [Pseudomonadota bacterium]
MICAGALLAEPAWGENYRFDTGLRLGPATLFEPWWQTIERNDKQWAAFEACLADVEDCSRRERVLRRLLRRAPELSPADQLQLVNRYVNHRDYEVDRRSNDHTGERRPRGSPRSHWSTLFEFMRRGGDCEDYAAAKYFLLRRLGFAPEDLRVVVTWEKRERGYHAVLAVRRPDGAVWLLETDNRIKRRSHAGYRYVYAVNDQAVWDYRDAPN